MKTQKATILIPLYKPAYSGYEKVSLEQCCKILGKYTFSLVCPEDLNISAYEKILKNHKISYEIERFPAKYFPSVKAYNGLMLNADFYRRFSQYEYMLIYQLDAYVFRDELEYWCEQGYDYVGAPWFERFSNCATDSKLLDIAGNGGFSLRKIASAVKALIPEGEAKKFVEEYVKDRKNEDIFFSVHAKEIVRDFKIAPPKEAMRFSFECLPEKLYQMTGEKLPFGCHAWERYGSDFWERFIDLSSVDFKAEFKHARSDLSLAKGKLDSRQAQLDSARAELKLAKTQLESTKSQLDSTGAELGDVYSSREWRVAMAMQRIVKFLFPSGSLRRKSIVSFWMIAKASLRLARKIKGKLMFCKSYLCKILKPKKPRKINLKSKKIVYIGHSYHNKTKSTEFLIDYLKQSYDVKILSDDSWQGKPFPDLSFVGDGYLGVIFFQLLPPKDILRKIKNDNIIYFPMYDGVPLSQEFWENYRDLKIVNFSSTLHKKLTKWGFDSMYIQYFPDLQKFIPGKGDEIFFWQRITKININIIIKLFGKEKLKIHIHKAIDPYEKFIDPNQEDEKKFQITYSDWFETRGEMLDLIKQKGIYVAPRELEGIGLSFLEAMAMGKAVIAVNNPTMNEYIEHGKTGYLFDLSKPKKIDFSNIDQVQKNAYEFMQEGRKRWEKDKEKIIDFIKKA